MTTTEVLKPTSKLEFIEYSEKSFAVLGVTKEEEGIHIRFKDIGGVFNRNLKCGAGWIFSKRHLQEVKAALGILAMLVMFLLVSSSATAQVRTPTGKTIAVTQYAGADITLAPLDKSLGLFGWLQIKYTVYPVYKGARGGLYVLRIPAKGGEVYKQYVTDQAEKIVKE